MGFKVKWLVFLVGTLDLIGTGFGEDNIVKTRFKKKLDYIFKY